MLGKALWAIVMTMSGGDPFLYGEHEWYFVQKDGYRYAMPPLECRVGEVHPYTLVALPHDEMVARWGADLGHYEPNGGEPVIYVAEGLPPVVAPDTLAHELAHLRGCVHDENGANSWNWVPFD